MGHTAELIAQLLNISREEMDEVALRSHNNVERATKKVTLRKKLYRLKFPRKRQTARYL